MIILSITLSATLLIITIMIILLIKNMENVNYVVNGSDNEAILNISIVDNIIMVIISKLILKELLNSRIDTDGNRIKMKELTDKGSPMYQGIIINTVSQISNNLKKEYYKFYSKTNDSLINYIIDLIDIYVMKLSTRLVSYDSEFVDEVREKLMNGKSSTIIQNPMAERGTSSHERLISSIIDDIDNFMNFKI